MRSLWAGEDNDGGVCARTLLNNVSGSNQEDVLLAPKTGNHQQQIVINVKFEVVHRHHNEGAGNFNVGGSCQKKIGVGVISLQRGMKWRITLMSNGVGRSPEHLFRSQQDARLSYSRLHAGKIRFSPQTK